MYKELILASVLTAAVTPAAFAADVLLTAVAPPVTYQSAGFDWSGFYAGLVGGYSWGKVETTETGIPPGPTWTVNPNGGLFGVTAGFNAQFDQFVLGAEGEVMWAGISGSGPDPRSALTTVSTKSEWQGTMKLRAGMAVDRILVYAHGGLAFADLKSDVVTGGSLDYQYNTTRAGFSIGAGLEAAITDNISVKAEYAYTDFGTWGGSYTGIGLPGNFDVEQKYAAHAIKAGVNLHF